MVKKNTKQYKLQKILIDYKKTNPQVKEALDIYEKAQTYRMRNLQSGTYKTTTSTKLSSIYTSR
jgi:hypothetical protein